MGKDATIYDVATLAGVSPSTVSRTFSRPDRVSFRTAEKIRAAAEELGYRAEVGTRGSTKPPSHSLGLVVADITNPSFQEVFRGTEHAARMEGMLDINIHNYGAQEYMTHTPETLSVFETTMTFENGMLHPSDTPGLGVTFHPEEAEKFPYEQAYLPYNRLADGTVHNW